MIYTSIYFWPPTDMETIYYKIEGPAGDTARHGRGDQEIRNL